MTCLVFFAELTRLRLKVVTQCLSIFGTTVLVAHRVNVQREASQTESFKKSLGQRNHFNVHVCISTSEHFDADLMMLAKATSLGSFVAK